MKKIFFGLLFLVAVLFLIKTEVYSARSTLTCARTTSNPNGTNFCNRSGSNTNCVNGKLMKHSRNSYKDCSPDCCSDNKCEEDEKDKDVEILLIKTRHLFN